MRPEWCRTYLEADKIVNIRQWATLLWSGNKAVSGTMERKVIVAQSCPTLWDPIDCSLSGSSVHGILQARILEWVAISFSRESSQPRDPTQISCTTGGFFTIWKYIFIRGSPGSSVGKEFVYNARDSISILGLGSSLGEGTVYLF